MDITPASSKLGFSRAGRRLKEISLTAMIDVVFILIFFFMLTTSFMRIESMELLLPSVSKTSAKKAEIVRIIIHNDGTLSFGQRKLEVDELELTLQVLFSENAKQQVVVYADSKVSMQEMVNIMDMVMETGGKSLYVRPLPRME